jgi:hypothetical protein
VLVRRAFLRSVQNLQLLPLEDGLIVLLLERDHVVDDAREFVRHCGNGLRRTKPGFHAAEVFSDVRRTTGPRRRWWPSLSIAGSKYRRCNSPVWFRTLSMIWLTRPLL